MMAKHLTWERLGERLPLLNVQELCRRADVPRHRIANAQRGRVRLTKEELDRIAGILQQLCATASKAPPKAAREGAGK